MAGLPLDVNVQFVTVMATRMPFIGRGQASAAAADAIFERPHRLALTDDLEHRRELAA